MIDYNQIRMKIKNRSYRYDINRTRSRHGHKDMPQYDNGYVEEATPNQNLKLSSRKS